MCQISHRRPTLDRVCGFPARKFNGGRICGVQSDADQTEGRYQTGTDCAVRRANESKTLLNSYFPRTRRIRHSICLLIFCDLKGGEMSARWGDIL